MISCPVVQTVLFVGPGSDPVRNSLNVVPDLFVAYVLDIRDLRVLDAELVTVVGANDGHTVAVDGDYVLDRGITLGLVQAVPTALVESACIVELVRYQRAASYIRRGWGWRRTESVGIEPGNVELPAKGVILEDLQQQLNKTSGARWSAYVYLVRCITSSTTDDS